MSIRRVVNEDFLKENLGEDITELNLENQKTLDKQLIDRIPFLA